MNRKYRTPRRWIVEQTKLTRQFRRHLILGTVALDRSKVDSEFCASFRKFVLETVTDPEDRAMLLDSFPPDVRRIK
jgi:hypothetical protein